jgi:two-component system sensor histidine kinase UhpB
VLRVIQEALMNVFRHAQATRVNITMEAMATHFKLQVADNGRGMSINQARSAPEAISVGVGIPAMKARLRQLGGTLEIRSSSATGGRGTTLSAELPLCPAQQRQRVGHHGHLGHHYRSIAGQH